MHRHDARIEQIRVHLRGVRFQEHRRENYTAFEMFSERGAQLCQDFRQRNSRLKPLLEWTRVDSEFGVLILNRQVCKHCGMKWGEHAPAGKKCLFEPTNYEAGPL